MGGYDWNSLFSCLTVPGDGGMKRGMRRKWITLMALMCMLQAGCRKLPDEADYQAGSTVSMQPEKLQQENEQQESIVQGSIVMGDEEETDDGALEEVPEAFEQQNEKPVDMSTANHEVNGRKLPVYCVDTPEKKIALTFDAAWGNEDTEKILEILEKHGVHATFFMTGGWVENYPDDVKRILAAGHDLGNHGENHKNMPQLSDEQCQEELMKVHARVQELTGYEMCLFRPPYGDYDNHVIDNALECGYYPIQWSIDSLDWKDYEIDEIIRRVVESDKLDSGGIILMHNGAKFTADALDSVITGLKDKGYEMVPISQLIYKDKYYMKVDGTQVLEE